MHHLWQWPSLEQSTAVKVGNTVQMHMQFKIPPPLSLSGGVMVVHYVVLAVLLESVRLFVYYYLSSTVTSPGPPPWQ